MKGPGRIKSPFLFEGLAHDASGAEHLAVFCHPDDGRAATMQVDSDVLSHRGLLPFDVSSLQDPSMLGSHKWRGPPFPAARQGQQTGVFGAFWNESLHSDGGSAGPPYSMHSLAIARARVGRSVQGRLQVLRP
jgi:hypothetical protein